MDNTGTSTPMRSNGVRRNRAISYQRLNGIRSEGRKNPFDIDSFQKLRNPLWSPTIMYCPENTPPQSEWTIDQMSKLNPVDIEGSPSSHQDDQELSPGSEKKIQAEIMTFFDTFNDSSPFGVERSLVTDVDQSLSGADMEQSSSSRPSIDSQCSLNNQNMDSSACSDCSDIDERKVHGGLFMSPTYVGQCCEKFPIVASPLASGSSPRNTNVSFNDSAMET